MTITEDSLIIYDEKVVFQKNKTLKLKKNLKYSAPRCHWSLLFITSMYTMKIYVL